MKNKKTFVKRIVGDVLEVVEDYVVEWVEEEDQDPKMEDELNRLIEILIKVRRPKHGESTLCTHTEKGIVIHEGDILGHGDNYPCVVLYNPYEAKFDALEFGYKTSEGYLYRRHDLSSTVPWKVLGSIDRGVNLLKEFPADFDYVEDIRKSYEPSEIKKTSKEWYALIPEEFGLRILDPDGWDRSNYNYSFNQELIDVDEFIHRVMFSTIYDKHMGWGSYLKNLKD